MDLLPGLVARAPEVDITFGESPDEAIIHAIRSTPIRQITVHHPAAEVWSALKAGTWQRVSCVVAKTAVPSLLLRPASPRDPVTLFENRVGVSQHRIGPGRLATTAGQLAAALEGGATLAFDTLRVDGGDRLSLLQPYVDQLRAEVLTVATVPSSCEALVDALCALAPIAEVFDLQFLKLTAEDLGPARGCGRASSGSGARASARPRTRGSPAFRPSDRETAGVAGGCSGNPDHRTRRRRRPGRAGESLDRCPRPCAVPSPRHFWRAQGLVKLERGVPSTHPLRPKLRRLWESLAQFGTDVSSTTRDGRAARPQTTRPPLGAESGRTPKGSGRGRRGRGSRVAPPRPGRGTEGSPDAPGGARLDAPPLLRTRGWSMWLTTFMGSSVPDGVDVPARRCRPRVVCGGSRLPFFEPQGCTVVHRGQRGRSPETRRLIPQFVGRLEQAGAERRVDLEPPDTGDTGVASGETGATGDTSSPEPTGETGTGPTAPDSTGDTGETRPKAGLEVSVAAMG